MEVPAADIKKSIRSTNYTTERASIQQKLANPRISDGKKERLEFRLSDLDNRLIPETARRVD